MYTGNICLYSPHILIPDYTSVDSTSKHLKNFSTIQDACEHLMYPQENLKEYFDKIYISYLRHILSQFIRDFDDKRYPYFKIPRHQDKNFKNKIKMQSKLLGKLWELIKLLSHNFYDTPLSFIFFLIVKEHDLVIFDCLRSEKNDELTIRELKKKIQNQNSFLTNYDYSKGIEKKLKSDIIFLPSNDSTEEIPFNKEKSPSTVGFLEICHIEAGKNNSFRSHYLEFVKCRKSLTTIIFQKGKNLCKKGSEKQIEHRGRR